MQKLHRLFTLFLLLSVFSGCFISKEHESSKFKIVDENGLVCPQVTEILKLTDVQTDGTLSDIVAKTQALWLRKPGQYRWEMDKLTTKHDQQLQKLFHEMHMYDEIKPIKKHYNYLMILGGLFKTMQQRLDFAINLYNSGITFDHIVLLASARTALPDKGEHKEAFLSYSNQAALHKIPETEAEMLQFTYDHANMPEAMKKISMQIINVPIQLNDDGTLKRPTTQDTIIWWLKTNPQAGTCLAISNQPYVQFQHSVLHATLPQNFDVETVGYASKAQELAVMLDTLARILYQEQEYLQNQITN